MVAEGGISGGVTDPDGLSGGWDRPLLTYVSDGDLETVHDGLHDNNSRSDPSRPHATKPPFLSRWTSLIDYAIRPLYFGTQNQVLWLHHKQKNVLS